MKCKIKIGLALILSFIILTFVGCDKEKNLSEKLIGQWGIENSDEVIIEFFNDGTCILANTYGTSTWSISENTLKIIDFYGETQTLTVNEINNEKMILSHGESSATFIRITSDANSALNTTDNTSTKLIDAKPFSEGIAWVKYIDSENNENIGWLDTNGKITVPSPIQKCKKMGSSFNNGYTYINYEQHSDKTLSQFIILDKKGIITFQSPSDGSYEIVTGGDGIYLVRQTVLGMDTNEERYGFIDYKGNWVLKPTVNHPLMLSTEEKNSLWKEKVSFYYLGEHVFCAYYNSNYQVNDYEDDYACFYNIDSKVSTKHLGIKISDESKYYNGKTIVYSEDTVYALDANGNINPILEDRPDGNIFYQEGIFFTGKVHYSGNAPSPIIENGKFYNIDGSVLIDLSQYTLITQDASDLYRFENGHAAILIYGADFNWYLGILDLNGKFTFEPLVIDWASNIDLIGIYSCDTIAATIEKNIDGSTYTSTGLINTNGTITTTDNRYIGNLKFTDGFAWDEQTHQFIDTKGTVLSIYIENQ